MRINRTFSLPVKLAIRLKACRNQSAVVERAVNKYLDEKDDFSLADVPTRQLLAALHARDLDPVLNAALLSSLNRL